MSLVTSQAPEQWRMTKSSFAGSAQVSLAAPFPSSQGLSEARRLRLQSAFRGTAQKQSALLRCCFLLTIKHLHFTKRIIAELSRWVDRPVAGDYVGKSVLNPGPEFKAHADWTPFEIGEAARRDSQQLPLSELVITAPFTRSLVTPAPQREVSAATHRSN